VNVKIAAHAVSSSINAPSSNVLIAIPVNHFVPYTASDRPCAGNIHGRVLKRHMNPAGIISLINF